MFSSDCMIKNLYVTDWGCSCPVMCLLANKTIYSGANIFKCFFFFSFPTCDLARRTKPGAASSGLRVKVTLKKRCAL